MAEPTRGEARPLALVVFSGGFDRVHYALAIAAAALACDRPVTLFFTMEAARALARPGPDCGPGWAALAAAPDGQTAVAQDSALRAKGIAGFEDLLAACVALGASVMVCEMGLRAIGLGLDALRDDVPVRPGGLVTFLGGIDGGTATMFV